MKLGVFQYIPFLVLCALLSGCFSSSADEDFHPGVEPPPANLVIDESLQSSSVSFGYGFINQTATKTFRLTNQGRKTAENVSINIPSPFSLVSHNCGTSIAKGASCTITVGYSPSLGGENDASVDISYNNGVAAAAKTYTMTGIGIQAIGEWAWVDGEETRNAAASFGAKGVADSSNRVPALYDGVSFQDTLGNLWVFGGRSTWAAPGSYNALWKWNGTTWTWIVGDSDMSGDLVTSGKGLTSPTTTPGGKSGAAAWVDSNNNFWLYGGNHNSLSTSFFRTDLWKWDGVNWTWVSGEVIPNRGGVYGTRGVPDVNNRPGNSVRTSHWIDSSQNLWIFGGYGCVEEDSYRPSRCGTSGYYNTLWKYNIASDQWTWVTGSDDINESGVYGTKGSAHANNTPGSRMGAASWMDNSGNFWVFGGAGYDSAGTFGVLNDLWKFDGTHWTWVAGSNTVNQSGVYGTRGLAEAANTPGGRMGSVAWKDAHGNLWLFGGKAATNEGVNINHLNDLWKWDGYKWAWVAGTENADQAGVYGTRGVASTSNLPGARMGAVPWISPDGKLYLFGGRGKDSAGNVGMLNDLWLYEP